MLLPNKTKFSGRPFIPTKRSDFLRTPSCAGSAMNEHRGAVAALPGGHTPPPLLPHRQTSELTVSQWARNVQTDCNSTGTQTSQRCYENAQYCPQHTPGSRWVSGRSLERRPCPRTATCRPPLGAGATRFGCQPPAPVTCLGGGREVLVTRDRPGCHTQSPQGCPWGGQAATTRHRSTPG